MYSDTQAVPLLQEIGITNANDKVILLSTGPISKESKVSPKFVISFSKLSLVLNVDVRIRNFVVRHRFVIKFTQLAYQAWKMRNAAF